MAPRQYRSDDTSGGLARPIGIFRDGRPAGAYDTVLIVPLDDLPDWLPAWCLDHLGGEPSDVLFQLGTSSRTPPPGLTEP
jgi:hypothetical protein